MQQTVPYPLRPRIVLLGTTIANVARGDLCRAGDVVASGCGAMLRIGLRHPHDPFTAIMAGRPASAPLDLAVEVTLAEHSQLESLVGIARPLGHAFGPLLAARGIEILAGMAHLIVPGDDAILLAVAARRDPSIDVADLRRWWVQQHATLAQRIVRPFPTGYEQLHVDRELSARAAAAAGIEHEPRDLFDSINVSSIDSLTSAVMNPAIAAQLAEDERGHVDMESLRGAVTEVIHRSGSTAGKNTIAAARMR